jgi:multicomponent Na+:H+ antiporter subunit D
MTDLVFPPGAILVLAGLVLPLLNEQARKALILLAPLLTLATVWSLPDGVALSVGYLGMELEPVKSDALSRMFGTVFAGMAFAGGLYALNQAKVRELAAALVYAGSAIGVVFAGDLITVFIFWEAMAIASTIVVWSGGAGARNAGLRYAVIHFFGGVILMAGIAGEFATTGSVRFDAMQPDSLARWMILAGFVINTGAPPLQAWLPDAYPKASWSGMVFLSAFTTKAAVYVLIRGFPGAEVLIWIGLFMIFYGIVYAILENDMRRILAYSICNQVGFMVCAIGIGTEMALNGAAAHAFVHIIYKALLLMSAGSVLYMTGKRKCTDLGGLFRTMPVSCICGIVGALSISAFPATSGFVAKSLISSAAAEQHMVLVWFALAAASAGVFLHAGIKFPWFVFFHKDSGLRPEDPPWNMRAAMILLSILCVGLGLWWAPLYAMLPFTTGYQPYTPDHVVFQLQLLMFSGLAFFLLLGVLKRTLTITLDVDWFWRRAGRLFAEEFGGQWLRAYGELGARGYAAAHPRPRGRAGADPAIGLHGAVDDCPLVGVSVAVVPLTVYRRNKLPVLR